MSLRSKMPWRTSIAAVVAMTAVACGARSTAPPHSAALFGTPITMRPGETVVAGAQTICFGSVLSDSRCPVDVDRACGPEDEAVVRFVVGYTNPDIKAPYVAVDLHTGSGASPAGTALGYRLILLRLDPAPRLGVVVQPANYRATIEIQPDTDQAVVAKPGTGR